MRGWKHVWGGLPGLSTSCEPSLFTNALHFPQSVTVHDEFVYWTVYEDCPLSSSGLERGSGKVMGARRRDARLSVDFRARSPRFESTRRDYARVDWRSSGLGHSRRALREKPQAVLFGLEKVIGRDDDSLLRWCRDRR
ncbi:MAG: hypothetical protein WDO74_15040 [Pseudomonadota bacterium]